MQRREFITVLNGAALWTFGARAQPADRIRRIGLLTGFPQGDSIGTSLLEAFRGRLAAAGWMEGRNLSIEIRWADADPERMRAYAGDLVRMRPDLIVVHGPKALSAVRQQTDRIPILFASVADPVGAGLVASLARPGGNITGFAVYVGAPTPKLVEALKEVAPGMTHAALVITPDNVGMARQLKAMENVAPALGVTAATLLIRDPAAIEPSIAAFARETKGGLVVTTDVFMIAHRRMIIEAAARHRLPAIYQDRSFVKDGGLMSYGVDRREQYRQVAIYVDRILKGEHPADLPVQQPSKFEFVLNLQTARALGIEVTRTLLARADEVIE